MQKAIARLDGIKLVGIMVRTNNDTVFESDLSTSPIAATVQKYFHQGLSGKIPARKNPGTTFCVYTNYESYFTGDYTYFIEEEVTSFEEL
jgi:predicted transcriptional regulator YdeE